MATRSGKIQLTGQRLGGQFRYLGIFSLLGLASAIAEDKPPPPPPPLPPLEAMAWVDEVTDLPPGPHRELRPVKIDFGLSWNNVLNAGELSIQLADQNASKSDRVWIGRAEGRSNGLARALWPYDVEAVSHIDPDSLRPSLFELSEVEKKKSYKYRIQFEPDCVRTRTVTISAESKTEADSGNEVKESTFRYDAIQDILSTALYLRSQELEKGQTIRTLVSPFNRPYYTAFKSMGREVRKVKGEKYDTIRLDVDIRKVNFDRTLQDYDKMKNATIWLSDDEFRLPVEIHADIFVGFVSARALNREWLDQKRSPTVKAGKPSSPEKKRGFLDGLRSKE